MEKGEYSCPKCSQLLIKVHGHRFCKDCNMYWEICGTPKKVQETYWRLYELARKQRHTKKEKEERKELENIIISYSAELRGEKPKESLICKNCGLKVSPKNLSYNPKEWKEHDGLCNLCWNKKHDKEVNKMYRDKKNDEKKRAI